MLLSVQSNENAGKSKELLDVYLKGALSFFGNDATKGEARAATKGFARGGTPEQDAYWGRPDIRQIQMTDVEAKQAEIKSRLDEYGIKEKVNYALNAQAYKNKEKNGRGGSVSDIVTFVAGMTVTAAMFPKDAPVTLEGMGAIGIGIAGSVGIILAKKGLYKAVGAKTPAEENKMNQYMTLKHTQLALKQLKRQLVKERDGSYKQQVQKLFAAGFGNPGGVITTIASDKRGR